MAKTQRDPAREQFWHDAIAAWRSSGLTVRGFCEQRQLTETTFHHWRRELRRRDAAAPRTASPAFVPVTGHVWGVAELLEWIGGWRNRHERRRVAKGLLP